jgi:serine O-acetyltransferase
MKLIFLKNEIKKDLYRYAGNINLKSFVKSYLLIPGFNYMVWFRIGTYYNNFFIKYIIFRKSIKFGIQIPLNTKIGSGFYIGHFGNIVINGRSSIGENCNISQGVTIGQSSRGKNKGYPQIGNNCYIAPGVKIIGNIKIGNNVAIGANAVVTKDIEDNSVVVGIPAKIISKLGSDNYIINKIEELNETN